MTVTDPGGSRLVPAQDADTAHAREPEDGRAGRTEGGPARALPRPADGETRLGFLLALVEGLSPMDDPAAIGVVASRMLADHLGDARAEYVDLDEAAPPPRLAGIRDILAGGHPLVIDPPFTDPLVVPGLEAEVIAAVVRRGRVVAALSVGRPAPHRWSADEVSLIEEVAGRTAAAIDRARVEAGRREAESRYRTLFEAMDRGFAVWDAVRGDDGRIRDLRCVEMNHAFERLTALRRADSIGRLTSELLGDPEDWWLRTCERVVDGSEAVRFEHHLGASERWHEVAAFPFGRDRLAALYDDITRRKRAEAALAQSAERDAFRVALGDAFRPLGDPLAIQAAATRMLGWHLGAVGVHYGELEPDGLHVQVAHGRPSAQPERYLLFSLPRLAVHMKAGRILTIDDVEDDAHLRPRERDTLRAQGIGALIAVPLVEEGRLVALLVVQREAAYSWPLDEVSLVEETAERTRAEVERARAGRSIADDLRDTRLLRELGSRLAGEGDLRVLHDQVMEAALAVANADGGALHIVDRVSGELRLLATRGLGGRLLEHLGHLAAGSSIPAATARLSGRRVVADFADPDAEPEEGARLHAESGFRSTQATPLLARSGEVIGVLSTCWARSTPPRERELRFLDLLARQAADLIEGRRATRALRHAVEVATEARREAEAANRAKDEFLAMLSHELRTPLTPIVLWGRLLLDGQVPLAELGRVVQVIVTSAETQSRLIEDLLDLSRSTTGRLSLQPESTDVASLVRAAMELVRPTSEARRQRLELVADPDLDRAMLDPRRFQQVVWNLLSNAVKFTPDGGRITVQLRAEPGRLRIEVADTGEGMPPELLPVAFERFRQANMGEDRRHGGLGIGLALCRDLVLLHGGQIEARSDGPGLGSVFTIRLPVPGGEEPAPVSADPATRARPRSG